MTHKIANRHEVYPPDTGCEYHPSCLTCPLPLCKYDFRIQHGSARHEIRNNQILLAFEKGLTREEIAKMFTLSERQVYRIVRRVSQVF